MTAKKLAYGAAIAAAYAALTLLFAPISFYAIQCRIAEALTILPVFTPHAIWGLFIGCLIANIIGGLGIWDIVLGSLATLIAAALTYKLRNRLYLAPLPPVIVNALIVGGYVHYLYTSDIPLYLCMLYIAAGQIVACYALGIPLAKLLSRYKHKFF